MVFRLGRRGLIRMAGCAGAMLSMPSMAMAEGFPDKSTVIRAIIPNSTGGTADIWGRPYAQVMGEILGNNVIVDNRPGADGAIGMMVVKNAKPDGYTLLFTSLSTQVVSPHLYKQLPYDPLKDFVPLRGTLQAPFFAYVGPSVPFKSASEFFAAAKANPRKYTFGSISTATKLSGYMLAKAANVELLNVPYKNFGDLMSNLVSGRIDLYMSDASSVIPFLSQGVRAIGAASSARVAISPETPTLAEQGLPGFAITAWHAAYAPAKTPEAVLAILRNTMREASRSQPVVDALSRVGAEPFDLEGDELAKFQAAEFERWGQAAREAGVAGTL